MRNSGRGRGRSGRGRGRSGGRGGRFQRGNSFKKGKIILIQAHNKKNINSTHTHTETRIMLRMQA